MTTNMDEARKLATRGNFAGAILALGETGTQEDMDELSMLTQEAQLRDWRELYRPALARAHAAVETGEIEATVQAVKEFRSSREFAPPGSDTLRGDLERLFRKAYEYVIEPLIREQPEMAAEACWQLGFIPVCELR